MPAKYTPTVLTIAGSDPYGGAGIQVDSKVIHALDGYAFSVTTALTAQNSTGVKDVLPTSAEHFKTQLHTILDDIKVDAVKIGMLANAEIISIVAQAIEKYQLKNIVLDTVLVSSSGKALLEPSVVEVMVKELFPRVDLITPNIPEVNRLLGTDFIGRSDEIAVMAKGLFQLGANNVLIKGGHSHDKKSATDHFVEQASEVVPFTTIRLETSHTHGTGCVLSSAIATNLAKNENLKNSVQLAKDFLYQYLQTSSDIKFNYHTQNDTRKQPLI
jgi:hydroxymethylpyrimidine/phosphomethylpyrimidine kinase